jgi:glutamyl-tRNA reductase
MLVLGVSHKTIALDERERFSVPKDALPALLSSLRSEGTIAEAVCLSTCNRTEFFVRPEGVSLGDANLGAGSVSMQNANESLRKALSRISGIKNVDRMLYQRAGGDAIRHIFRLAASLDSLVVGEPQILGQLKDAFEAASSNGLIGGQLGKCIMHSFHVAKRVRSETRIGEGSVSISSVAVDLARGVFGSLDNASVLLVGAGEMAEAAARSLAKDASRIRVCNRSIERAAELAAKFQGSASTLDALEQELLLADVVVTGTAATHYVVTQELAARVMKARRGRTLLFVDIAVPRNVDPAIHGINNVYVFNIDDLQQETERNAGSRSRAVAEAERIVDLELESFMRWTKSLHVQPVLLAIRAKTKAILTTELERTLSGKLSHLSEADRAVLAKMMDSATNKLLHAPTVRLRESSDGVDPLQLAHIAEQLFDVQGVSFHENQVRESTHQRAHQQALDPNDAAHASHHHGDHQGQKNDPKGNLQ